MRQQVSGIYAIDTPPKIVNPSRSVEVAVITVCAEELFDGRCPRVNVAFPLGFPQRAVVWKFSDRMFLVRSSLVGRGAASCGRLGVAGEGITRDQLGLVSASGDSGAAAAGFGPSFFTIPMHYMRRAFSGLALITCRDRS